jgi:2-polyprenyl-3-methyl-5-hydroxy-6-metoxy-1,4-benzoquinol methylase
MHVKTNHPFATASEDFKNPRGSKQDNTHCPRFVDFCRRALFAKPCLLDLGCAGGGLVKDFLDEGFVAFGIDGSDYGIKHGQGEWPNIPHNLGNADATKPFLVVGDDQPEEAVLFNVITAWEVMEHIQVDDVPDLLLNVRLHLAHGGVFIMSIATFDDGHWHVTLKPRDWWIDRLVRSGFRMLQVQLPVEDLPRGSGNPLTLGDWKGDQHGFHLICTHQ